MRKYKKSSLPILKAFSEVKSDLKHGRYLTQSVKDHIKDLKRK